MLSIVIPHYNSIDSLKKLLNSIPKKHDIEIIVVDDNSNEDQEQLKKLKSNAKYNHIKFLENNSINKGAGSCRNIGMNNIIKGNWVLFADADDLFVEGFYSKVKKYFNTKYDVVFFAPTSLDINTGTLSDRHIVYKTYIDNYKFNYSLKSELDLRYKFYVPWSKLYNINFLKENNIYFDEVIASNDVMFSTKVGYFMSEFEVSTQVIYCVTKNKGSLTVNTNERVYNARVRTHIKYFDFLKEKLSSSEIKSLDPHGGMGYLINAIRFRYGFKKVISTYFLFKKAKVKVFDFRYLNPFFLTSRIIKQYKITKRDKEYYL